MKKILLGISCLLGCVLSMQAQILYGTTPRGGSDGGGTINKFQPATNNLIVTKSLEFLAQSPDYSNFIQAKDGKLYGMTGSGGKSNAGVIFSFDPVSKTYTKRKDFDGINGANPGGGLMLARNGKLYGMTTSGGSNNGGVIFSFDPSSFKYKKLKDFDGINGGSPWSHLMQANDGKLYGMTSAGGSNNFGVIFSFDPASKTYTKLKDFDGINGGDPQGGFIQARDGNLYGMAGGGSDNAGVIFSFDPASKTYTKLKDFDNTNGGGPFGSLMLARNGKLYGMTTYGGSNNGGVIFSFDPLSSTYTKLKDFDNNDGANPYGSFIQATDGKLYGLTNAGGNSGDGVIFSFDPSSSIYAKLKDFDKINGSGPRGSLMQAKDGKLYGMALGGKNVGYGVIFSFNPLSSTYKMLEDFGTNQNGSFVSGHLIQVKDGKMYGMTTNGGSNAAGVIFSFDPSSSKYKKLKDFDYANGGNPNGNYLMQATDGKLYGMTSLGGTTGVGVIFSFAPSSSTYTKLKDFDKANGGYPSGGLVQATDGKLYGMMEGGTTTGFGVIFSFEPSSSTYTKLKDFDYPDGAGSFGSLVQASDGKLYGMMEGGGKNGYGVIFSFDPSSSKYKKLQDFDNINGAGPCGNLVQARDGKLYGMTREGGTIFAGVIFSFDPSTSTYTKLKDFDNNNDGYEPLGNLMQASDGKLYGMTDKGGMNGYGVIFSFDLKSSIYTKLQDYTGDNGAGAPFTPPSPSGRQFIELNESPLLRISDAIVYEAAGTVTLTVELSKKTDQDVSVDYKTVNGTAKIPFDYTEEKGTVIIHAGSKRTSISVPIISDNMREPKEQFYVELDNPVNASMEKNTGTVTILDGGCFNPTNSKTNNEQNQEAQFTLTASPNPSSSQFLLQIETNNLDELLSLRVVDVCGKMVEEKNNIFSGQTLQIGNNYKPGVYFVVITQGNNRKQLKLIKL